MRPTEKGTTRYPFFLEAIGSLWSLLSGERPKVFVYVVILTIGILMDTV
jgi:hypothetical protein